MHNTDYAQAAGTIVPLAPDHELSVADDNYHICNGPA
jgi:hypothetical protein